MYNVGYCFWLNSRICFRLESRDTPVGRMYGCVRYTFSLKRDADGVRVSDECTSYCSRWYTRLDMARSDMSWYVKYRVSCRERSNTEFAPS